MQYDDLTPPGWDIERAHRLLGDGSPGWSHIIDQDASRMADLLVDRLRTHRGRSLYAKVDVVEHEAGTPERVPLWAQARACMRDDDASLARHWSDVLGGALTDVLRAWSEPAPESRARALVKEIDRGWREGSSSGDPGLARRARAQRLVQAGDGPEA